MLRDSIYLGNKPIALISMPEGIRIGPIGCPSICTISGYKEEKVVAGFSLRNKTEHRLVVGSALNALLYFSPFIFLVCWRIFRRRKYSALYAGLLTIGVVVILIVVAKRSMAQSSNESIYYYHTDHLGTPIRLTDANQSIAWDADYDPFGKATVTTASVTNNLRFPGQYYDTETGLHYNWHRYYWPDVGRYVQSSFLEISTYTIIVDLLSSYLHHKQLIARISNFSQSVLYKLAEVNIKNLPLPLFGGTFKDLSFDQNLLLQPLMLNAYPYVVNNPLRVTDELGLYACMGCAPKCKLPTCPSPSKCPNAKDCWKWYNKEVAKCALTCPGGTAGTGYVACQGEAYRCLALCLSWTGER